MQRGLGIGLFAVLAVSLTVSSGPIWATENTHGGSNDSNSTTTNNNNTSPTPAAETKDSDSDKNREKVEEALKKIEDLEKIDENSAADLKVEDLLDHKDKLKKEIKDAEEAKKNGETPTEEETKKLEQAEGELAKVEKIIAARVKPLTESPTASNNPDLAPDPAQFLSSTTSTTTSLNNSMASWAQPVPFSAPAESTSSSQPVVSAPSLSNAMQSTPSKPVTPPAISQTNPTPTVTPTSSAVTPVSIASPVPVTTFSNSRPSLTSYETPGVEAMKLGEPPPPATEKVGGRYIAPSTDSGVVSNDSGGVIASASQTPPALSSISAVSPAAPAPQSVTEFSNTGFGSQNFSSEVPLVIKNNPVSGDPTLDAVEKAALGANFFSGPLAAPVESANLGRSQRPVADSSREFRAVMAKAAETPAVDFEVGTSREPDQQTGEQPEPRTVSTNIRRTTPYRAADIVVPAQNESNRNPSKNEVALSGYGIAGKTSTSSLPRGTTKSSTDLDAFTKKVSSQIKG